MRPRQAALKPHSLASFLKVKWIHSFRAKGRGVGRSPFQRWERREADDPSCWNLRGLEGRWVPSAPRDEEADEGIAQWHLN